MVREKPYTSLLKVGARVVEGGRKRKGRQLDRRLQEKQKKSPERRGKIKLTVTLSCKADQESGQRESGDAEILIHPLWCEDVTEPIQEHLSGKNQLRPPSLGKQELR